MAVPREERMALGIRPTVDFVFKKTFGVPSNREALISLLNALLQWPEPIEDVEIENPFQYQDFLEDKLSVLDIKARNAAGVVFHVEMQVSVPASTPKRLAYYAFEQFTGQLGRGGDYRNLRPVYSICLLDAPVWPVDPVGHHRFRMMDPATGREYEQVVEIHLVEMSKYTEREGDLVGASDAARWIYWLRHAHEYDPVVLRRLFPEAGFHRAIDAIEEIARRTEDLEMYDSRLKAARDRQWLLEETLAEGLQKGLEQGLEKGLEQGLVRGLEQGLDQGLVKGLEKGLEQGDLLGRIRLSRSLLGQPPLGEEEWRDKSLAELRDWAGRLEVELRQGRG